MVRQLTATEWLSQFKIGQVCYFIDYSTRTINTATVCTLNNSKTRPSVGFIYNESRRCYFTMDNRDTIHKTEKSAINSLSKFIKEKINRSEKYIVELKKELDVLNNKETN